MPEAHQGHIQAAHPEGLGTHCAPRLGPSPLDRARDLSSLISHGPAHRGANGAAITTDEDDQADHFLFNYPVKGGYFAA